MFPRGALVNLLLLRQNPMSKATYRREHLIFRGLKSMAIVAGFMAAGRQVAGVAESLRGETTLEGQRKSQMKWPGLRSLKTRPE